MLALKRAEQPPPGYFNSFAGKVIARIEAEGLAAPKPWWARLFAPAAWTPGLAGANTAIVAGLAMLGGTAWYFQSRPEKSAGLDTAARGTARQTDPSGQNQFLLTAPATPLAAGFDPTDFVRPTSPRPNLVHLAPMAQFQIRHPSVRDRAQSTDTDTVPPGIFEPWSTERTASTSRALPTSIVNYVESPRP